MKIKLRIGIKLSLGLEQNKAHLLANLKVCEYLKLSPGLKDIFAIQIASEIPLS